MAGWFASAAAAAEVVDEVVWEQPGYTVTVHRTGLVRVDEVPYDPEKEFREQQGHPMRIKEFFLVIDSADLSGLKPSYRWPEGKLRHGRHEVLTAFTFKSRGEVVKQVELGSTVAPEWPAFLQELEKEIRLLASADGRPLSPAPWLD
ncbi:MAG: hypothetical protein HYZ94_01685 [Candidatus Omnitrophica bacterium]|nr:hypothetical protein [Candidatus Omnitrophota bacterium]